MDPTKDEEVKQFTTSSIPINMEEYIMIREALQSYAIFLRDLATTIRKQNTLAILELIEAAEEIEAKANKFRHLPYVLFKRGKGEAWP